jgi:hypothetical protein
LQVWPAAILSFRLDCSRPLASGSKIRRLIHQY